MCENQLTNQIQLQFALMIPGSEISQKYPNADNSHVVNSPLLSLA